MPNSPRTLNPVSMAAALHLAVVLAGLPLLSLAPSSSPAAGAAMILAFALFKTVVYGVAVQRLATQFIDEPSRRFDELLVRLSVLMVVMVTSFGCDFFALFVIDPSALANMPAEASSLEQLFNCWYFSALNWSFFGVSDFVPAALATRVLLLLETAASFLTLLFVLSDFVALRESRRHAQT